MATLPAVMKQRLLTMLAGLAALFGMSSCLEVESVISLKKDGSGTLTEEVVMGKQLVDMMEGGLGAAGGENPFADMYDPEKYKEKAATYGEGVKYSKMEKIERNGGKGVKVTYTFEDINKVTLNPGSALDDLNQGAGDENEEEPVGFSYKDGELTIVFPDVPEGGEAGDAEGIDPAAAAGAEAMIAQMFKDMKMSAKVVVEPGIAKTDATHVEGNTITLMEMNFAEIIKNPEGLKILQKMEGMSRAEAAKALKDVKGVKVETKEKVTVKVK